MKIVVTGASGNIGTALLRWLQSDGGHELHGVVRRVPEPIGVYREVEWHSVDLSATAATAELTEIFAGADAVVHLAWGFQPSHDLEYLRRLGVDGSLAVLTAADRAGVAHLVHMSSVGAYSRAPGVRVDESAARNGVPTSAYSVHKATAERNLDAYEARGGAMIVSRLRPGFVVQPDAASGLLRYGVPGWVPARALALLPVLPLDDALAIPVIHADDVADATVRVLQQRAPGAFNLAGEPPLTRADIARALHAIGVQVPAKVLSVLAAATWRLRLQALSSGWVDLAFSVPLLDTTRARDELGWTPAVDARQALTDTVAAMTRGQSTSSPVLRPRSIADAVRKLVTSGPVGSRRLP